MRHMRCEIALAVTFIVVAGALSAQEEPQSTDARSLATRFSDAWEENDAASMAELFKADGDLVLATGVKATGRSKIEKLLAAEFGSFMKGTRFRVSVDSVRELGPGVALMEGSAQLAGVKTPDGKAVRPLPHLVFAIVRQSEGEWIFEALRISVPVPTAPE